MGVKGIINNLINDFFYVTEVISTYISSKPKYNIKRGYIHKKEYIHFDDTINTDEWQKEVYLKAKEYVETNNLTSIIDYGCGSGYKLKNIFNQYDTIGIEVNPTYDFLKKKYPSDNWIEFGKFNFEDLSSDIVICSDVIEHVIDPDELINNIKQIKNVKYIFISTPDRNIIPSKQFGPPFNPSHIREWSFEELHKYISRHFDVVDHMVSNRKQWTQLIIVKPMKD